MFGAKRTRLETLECRSLLAADASVAVFGGNLFIQGSDANDTVEIQAGADAGSFTISGLDAGMLGDISSRFNHNVTTSADGTVSVSGVNHGVHINLRGGDDTLRLSGVDLNGNVHINTGAGNDTVEIGDDSTDNTADDGSGSTITDNGNSTGDDSTSGSTTDDNPGSVGDDSNAGSDIEQDDNNATSDNGSDSGDVTNDNSRSLGDNSGDDTSGQSTGDSTNDSASGDDSANDDSNTGDIADGNNGAVGDNSSGQGAVDGTTSGSSATNIGSNDDNPADPMTTVASTGEEPTNTGGSNVGDSMADNSVATMDNSVADGSDNSSMSTNAVGDGFGASVSSNISGDDGTTGAVATVASTTSTAGDNVDGTNGDTTTSGDAGSLRPSVDTDGRFDNIARLLENIQNRAARGDRFFDRIYDRFQDANVGGNIDPNRLQQVFNRLGIPDFPADNFDPDQVNAVLDRLNLSNADVNSLRQGIHQFVMDLRNNTDFDSGGSSDDGTTGDASVSVDHQLMIRRELVTTPSR